MFSVKRIIFCLCVALLHINTSHGDSAANRVELLKQFGDTVYDAPAIYPIPDRDVGSVQAIYYDALPYGDKPTRVFAYMGIPEAPAGKKLPAMVLAHGGGGTAFHDWVKIWNDKGYVAISMDLTGHTPEGNSAQRGSAHEFSGPHHTGMFDDQDKLRAEQWMYHAVADIMLANSLLRSLDVVDAKRVGLTGISWGGVLSSLSAGMDDRFVFSAPVYGCGYLYDSGGHFNRMGAGEDDAILEKRKYWDPARFFTKAPMPMLWVNGDNDPHFSVDTMTRSHVSAGPASMLSIHPKMPHGHTAGWLPDMVPEIYALADKLLKGTGAPLARIIQQPIQAGNTATLRYESEAPIESVALYWRKTPIEYATDENKRFDLVEQWHEADANLDSTTTTVSATLPEGCTEYYINLTDNRGCIISSNVTGAK